MSLIHEQRMHMKPADEHSFIGTLTTMFFGRKGGLLQSKFRRIFKISCCEELPSGHKLSNERNEELFCEPGCVTVTSISSPCFLLTMLCSSSIIYELQCLENKDAALLSRKYRFHKLSSFSRVISSKCVEGCVIGAWKKSHEMN